MGGDPASGPAAAGALAVVQARTSSTRLPGKVLADVGGEPLLALLLRRLARAETLDRIVVATSTDPGDDQVASLARRLGAGVHRGPLHDVLARFAGATAGHDGLVVRITGDCPLIDPGVVDATVALLAGAGEDVVYANDVDPRTFPVGLDVEVLRAATLHLVAAEATAAPDREHVTTYVRARPERFPRVVLRHCEDLSGLHWAVDAPDDLERVRRIVARLGDRRHDARLPELLVAARDG